VVVGSCIWDDGINRNLTSMYDAGTLGEFYLRWGVQSECLAATGGGCRAVEQCLGYKIEAYSGTCEPCTGTVAAFCEDGYRMQLDCSSIGLQCDPVAGCTDRSPAVACEWDTFTRVCTSDGRPQHCDGTTVATGPRCSELGLNCEDGHCVGTGEACQGSPFLALEGRIIFEGMACEGETLVACVAGRTQRLDCTTVHPEFACQSSEGYFFCGLGSECTPGDTATGPSSTVEQCEGTVVVVCNAGQVARVDCTELGFSGCDVDGACGCTPSLPAE
jgi:hypothetical protein